MIKNLLFLSLLFFSFVSQAQDYPRIIKGNVVDSATNLPLEDVTVSFFKASDTSLINFAFTTPNGNFELATKVKDSLLLVISQLGYEEVWKKIPAADNGGWWWSNEKIKLVKRPYNLNEVRVMGSAIWMRGDTIEILASRFKVMPGSDVSQLFAKIPGFKLDVKGNLTVDGSKVSKIMVDGSDFFGNNPGLVSKNLKADMVQTVQVYEDKDINGVPIEGQTKTINLKLKKGKRNGMFGDVLGGYGTNDRYEAGFRLNSFKNDRKFSFIANSNNINGTGFDFGFDNWHGDSYMFRNGSESSEGYYTYTSGGNDDITEDGNINRNTDVAFTYFNQFKKQRKFSFGGGLENNQFRSINTTTTQNLINDSTYQKNESSSNELGNASTYYIYADYTRRIDTTANISFGINMGISKINLKNTESTVVSLNDTILSSGLNQLETNQDRNHIEATYKYSKTSRKNKNLRWYIEVQDVTDFTVLDNYQFLQQNTDTLNMKRSKDKTMSEIHAKTGLKLPIYKDKWSYNLSSDFYTKGYINDQISKDALNPFLKDFGQDYNAKIDSLSLGFNNGVIQTSVVNGIAYLSKNMQITGGLTYLNFFLENSIIDGQLIHKNYNRFLPYFNLSNWNKKIGWLYLALGQSVDFPQANDLMPIQNLNDPFNRMIGNTNLNPQDKYYVRTQYSRRKSKYLDMFTVSINYGKTNNYITYAQTIGENGIVYQLPMNLNGYQTLSLYSNIEKTIKEILNLKLEYRSSITQTPQFINGQLAKSNQVRHNISPGIGLTISDNFDMDIDYTLSFLDGKNTLNPDLNFNQSTQALKVNLRGVFWGMTEVSLEGDFNDQRQVPGIGKIIPLVNCYIQQPLDKDQKYNLKLSCFDIFKQNVSISRYVTTGGYVISESNQLQRYFMITLVRKLNKSGKEEDLSMPVY